MYEPNPLPETGYMSSNHHPPVGRPDPDSHRSSRHSRRPGGHGPEGQGRGETMSKKKAATNTETNTAGNTSTHSTDTGKGEFKVCLLGSFRLTDGQHEIGRTQIHSIIAVRLIAWLAVHRTPQSTEVIMDALWDYDHDELSTSALKNVVYRLRRQLSEIWPGVDLILSYRGGYRWNPEVPLTLDTEQMRALYALSENESDDERREQLLRETVDLFGGPFMEGCNDHWIIAERVSCQNTYLKAVRQLDALLYARGEYQEIINRSRKALIQDNMDEQLHGWIMKSLLALDRREEARDYYMSLEQHFLDELGISPSGELQELYHQAAFGVSDSEGSLSDIARELHAYPREAGAFMCERGIFQQIYLLECRRGERFGLSSYLVLLTVNPEQNAVDADDEQAVRRSRSRTQKKMDLLQRSLVGNLRASDVVTRIGPRQYLAILGGCDYENARMVMERVMRTYMQGSRRGRTEVSYIMKVIRFKGDDDV